MSRPVAAPPESRSSQTTGTQGHLAATPEAVGRARLDAWRRDLASGEDQAVLDDRHALIAERTIALGREVRAEGVVGRILARRAAVLSVRVETLAHRDLIAVARDEADGRLAFDAARAEGLAHHRAILAADQADTAEVDPIPSLAALEADPDGLPCLRAAWDDLRGALRAGGLDCDPALTARARRWLRSAPESIAGDQLLARVDAEVARLRAQADRMGPAARALAHAREEAGILAGFHVSPERLAARRHEAAAERGFLRALKLLAELKPPAQARPTAPAAPIPATPVPAPTPAPSSVAATPPRPLPGATPASLPSPQLNSPTPTSSLGSFRPASSAASFVGVSATRSPAHSASPHRSGPKRRRAG